MLTASAKKRESSGLSSAKHWIQKPESVSVSNLIRASSNWAIGQPASSVRTPHSGCVSCNFMSDKPSDQSQMNFDDESSWPLGDYLIWLGPSREHLLQFGPVETFTQPCFITAWMAAGQPLKSDETGVPRHAHAMLFAPDGRKVWELYWDGDWPQDWPPPGPDKPRRRRKYKAP